MAHVPMDDAEALWNNAKDKSWEGIHQELQEEQNSSKIGIENALVDQLLHVTDRLRNSGSSFPDSPRELSKILNEHLK